MRNSASKISARFRLLAGLGLAGLTGLAVLTYGQIALTQPSQLLITEVFVDSPAVDQVRIVGIDFDSGANPEVSLGGFGLLTVQSSDATEIIADLPAGLAAGDYLLAVTTGGGSGREDTYDLTVADAAPPPPEPIPAGGIILWDQSNACPAGFARVTTIDGRFLVSDSVAGDTGGSNAHSHGAGSYTGPSHSHTLVPWNGQQSPVDDNSGGTDFNSTTSTAGGGTMTGTSASADSRPAFATVLLCRRT